MCVSTCLQDMSGTVPQEQSILIFLRQNICLARNFLRMLSWLARELRDEPVSIFPELGMEAQALCLCFRAASASAAAAAAAALFACGLWELKSRSSGCKACTSPAQHLLIPWFSCQTMTLFTKNSVLNKIILLLSDNT